MWPQDRGEPVAHRTPRSRCGECRTGATDTEAKKKLRPLWKAIGAKKKAPAASYSPTRSLVQYHRRWRASRPSSGWDRVWPLRRRHREGVGDHVGCAKHRTGRRNVFVQIMRPILMLQAVVGLNSPQGRQAHRQISTGRLRTSRCVHIRPINHVVYMVSNGDPSS
jgi:hypothetical protein